MKTRKELIDLCMKLEDVYEDYPFHDENWTAMRCKKTKKVFAFIYERNGCMCVNVKCHPDWIRFWQEAYKAVTPGYHMNKRYWNTVGLDGTIPDGDIQRMIEESYDLVK